MKLILLKKSLSSLQQFLLVGLCSEGGWYAFCLWLAQCKTTLTRNVIPKVTVTLFSNLGGSRRCYGWIRWRGWYGRHAEAVGILEKLKDERYKDERIFHVDNSKHVHHRCKQTVHSRILLKCLLPYLKFHDSLDSSKVCMVMFLK